MVHCWCLIVLYNLKNFKVQSTIACIYFFMASLATMSKVVHSFFYLQLKREGWPLFEITLSNILQ